MTTNKTSIIVRDYPDPRSFVEFTVDVATVSEATTDNIAPDGGRILRVTRQQLSHPASRDHSSSSSWWSWWSWCAGPRRVLSDLFLPLGYPDTVPNTYLSYQLYDSLQGLCSYLRGVWCAAAVLEAAGVGDATASAWAVAITWMTKDGWAIIGGLLYSYSASHLFDGHVKEFRLLADLMNDVGLTLDMLAPHVSRRRHLPYLAGTAVLCKTICSISAGATKGSITQHFAIAGNMADLNAKEATQETLMSLLGMILGVTAANVLVDHNTNDDHDTTMHHRLTSWTIFVVLTVIHVWANWKGVMLLRLRTLNRARADLVFAEWIRQSVDDACRDGVDSSLQKKNNGNDQDEQKEQCMQPLPKPDDVRESLWASFRNILFPRSIQLGVPLSQLLQQQQSKYKNNNNSCIIDDLYNLNKEKSETTTRTSTAAVHDQYVLLVCDDDASKNIKVCFLTDASEETILRAYLHARLVRAGIEKAVAGELLDVNFVALVRALSVAGWEVDRFYLDSNQCRSSWAAGKLSATSKRKME